MNYTAHSIRHALTRQFRAVTSVAAKYRWCLTGTPINNSLFDLGSLVEFLRIPLLQSKKTFREYIVKPIEKNKSNSVGNLCFLLKSICLRRTKDYVLLPEPQETVHKIELSAEEKELYSRVGKHARELLDEAISHPEKLKTYAVVLQTIIRLRRICNHGTMDQELLQNLPQQSTRTEDDCQLDCEISPDDSICLKCSCDIMVISLDTRSEAGCFTTCGHLLCIDCYAEWSEGIKSKPKKRGGASCSFCKDSKSPSFVSRLENGTNSPARMDLDGCSTKISRLVENIRQQAQEKWYVF
jgi:SWI/SNF-related matrix-associated actin-dependent regulator of chromatin subfamily A3